MTPVELLKALEDIYEYQDVVKKYIVDVTAFSTFHPEHSRLALPYSTLKTTGMDPINAKLQIFCEEALKVLVGCPKGHRPVDQPRSRALRQALIAVEARKASQLPEAEADAEFDERIEGLGPDMMLWAYNTYYTQMATDLMLRLDNNSSIEDIYIAETCLQS